MHIPYSDNQNKALFDVNNSTVPLVYFNIIKLKKGESFQYKLSNYETSVVPATGMVELTADGKKLGTIGKRTTDVWDGEPEGSYIPIDTDCTITCLSESTECFIAGGIYEKKLEPFLVLQKELDVVQYGSDDTKTHRKIKHILGAKQHEQVGRLLVNELYTVGAGGWSGFPPHKHDTDNIPTETRHDEVYNYRFKPGHGFGVQVMQYEDDKEGFGYQLFDGSTIGINKGYHPCVVAPGYEMYYFTILVGLSQRSLIQYFQKTHAYQIETIPGIKDMIAKYK
jgi:5-deoxy-glucuronate isomerase